MRVAAITGLAAAVATAAAGLAIATPSAAQPYGYYDNGRNPCQEKQHDHGIAGALLGGAAGAVIGSNVAGHSARTGGAIIGGVAGAALGNNIGRSAARSSDTCEPENAEERYRSGYYNNGYYNQGYYQQPQYNGYYGQPAYGNRYYNRHDDDDDY